MLDLNSLGMDEPVEIDSSTSISLPVSRMVAEVMLKFFNVEKGEDENYGLSESDVNDINSSPKDKQIDVFLNKLKIPSVEQPGFSNLIDKFIRAITKALLFFAKQFIALKESILAFIEPLKNPTNPQNYEKILQIINKLKGVLDDIKRMFTDTINWIKETFLGPLGEINMPIPSFVYNLGEIVPAFPLPLPIPQIPPTNMDSFIPEDSSQTIGDLLKSMFGYTDAANVAKLNIYKNIPYVQLMDTNFLVTNTFGERNPSDKEKASADIRRVSMFKGVSTSPIQIIIKFINAIISAIVGAISFNFNKAVELVKMMVPTIEGMMTLVSKLMDGMIPNISKVSQAVGTNLKYPTSQEELDNLKKLTTNVNVELEYNSIDPTIISKNIMEYNGIVDDIMNRKQNIERFIGNTPLANYITFVRNKSEELSKKETTVNLQLSAINVPDKFSISDYVLSVNELISNVNLLDAMFDVNGNQTYDRPNEKKITEFFDGSIPLVLNVNKYFKTRNVVQEFFDFFDKVENFPIKMKDMSQYTSDSESFLRLNKDIILAYFGKYTENYINISIEKLDKSIDYAKKLRYIKYIIKSTLLAKYREYRTLLEDFKNNHLILYETVYRDTTWVTSIENPSNSVDIMNKLENKYYKIKQFTFGVEFSYFGKSSYYSNITNLNSLLIRNIPDALRDFELSRPVREEGQIISTTGQTIEPTFRKEEIDDIIDIIDQIMNITNYRETLFIEIDPEKIEISQYGGVNYEEDEVIKFLNEMRKLYMIHYDFIQKDKELKIIIDQRFITNTLRTKTKDFLVNVIDKSEEIDNNDRNIDEIMKPVYDSIENEKKMAMTPPNMETISDNILPITKIFEAVPSVFLSLFTEVFNYALEPLPPILGGS
jgi:hypothetical protein